MSKQTNAGVTLLEILLVLAISVAILLASIRQYQLFAFDKDVQQVQYNVNTLFQSLSGYYQANCTTQNTDTKLPIDIQQDLIDNRFLTTVLPLNPLVYFSKASWMTGYVTQFNIKTATKYYCFGGSCDTSRPIGTIVTWIAQVAIKLPTDVAKDKGAATAYLGVLGGDCLSDLEGAVVAPCEENSTGTAYVVWERLPSDASPETQTDYWVTNPTVNQFNNMYNTYPIEYLLQNKGEMPQNTQQYYYCGS